jgi:hypothetical protein
MPPVLNKIPPYQQRMNASPPVWKNHFQNERVVLNTAMLKTDVEWAMEEAKENEEKVRDLLQKKAKGFAQQHPD